MSLGRHSIANLIGASLPLLVALITIPLYLRHIGPERYGVLAVILALTGYMGFIDLGLGRAVTQRIASLKDAPEKEHSDILWTALTTSFATGMLGGIGIWFGADYLLSHVIHLSQASRLEASTSVFWVGAALPLLLPGSALTGALHAKLRFVEVNAIQIFSGTLGLVLPLIVAIAGYTELTYLVPATLATRTLTVLLLLSQCRRHVPLLGWPCFHAHQLKPMLSYGGWISVMTILSPLLVTIDRLIIASLSGAHAVASYTVPYDLVSRAMVVPGSFSSALFPRLASAAQAEGRLLACRASATLVAIMTPTVLTGLFLSQPFLNLWVGTNFASTGRGVAEVILIGVWVNAIVIPHHTRYLATQSPRSVVIIFILELPIYLLMLWQGISHWGVVGAAVAWSARVLLDTALLLWLNNVFSITTLETLPSLTLIIIAGVVVYASPNNNAWHLLITVVLMMLSIFKDRQILLSAYRHVIHNASKFV